VSPSYYLIVTALLSLIALIAIRGRRRPADRTRARRDALRGCKYVTSW
jgi:hypothetical protein